MAGALWTDFYELTMAAGYHAAGMTERATFDLYVRRLPPNRSYLIAAGLEQALDYLEHLSFTAEEIDYLRGVPALRNVRREFFDDYLRRFRFTGDVCAIEEGTPVFPPEPLLRVTAPLPEAQVVETALLTIIGFQTSVASRASRVVEAAAGRAVAEFGARRAHGVDAGLHAARAAVLAGCESTSYVEAGHRFDIPVSGTMAHAWVTAFPDEMSAFLAYDDVFGAGTVLLLDTYDTIAAAKAVAASDLRPRAVRLDSGDLVELSKAVRAILDAGGLEQTAILVSGDLDEWRIADIVRAQAPVDGFGVGAAISTSSDAPSVGAVYKLAELERQGELVPIMKRSPGKHSTPGRKQVWRTFRDGVAAGDVISLSDERGGPSQRSLLAEVMKGGRRTSPRRPLSELRQQCRAAIAELPAEIRRLDSSTVYPVETSAPLQALIDRLVARV